VSTRSSTFATAEGTNTGAFTSGDWAILLVVSGIWGSSFLWIAVGLDSFSAPSVAFLRVALGGAALALYPPARRKVDRGAWPAIALIGIAGNAGPALLFALAQQRVESSVAGMINAATPLAVLVVSIVMLKKSPGRAQVIGLLVGFVGVMLMAAPNVLGVDAQLLGVFLLLVAVAGYGLTNNLVVPLQQRYGGPAVIMRALLFGAVLLAPWGVTGTIAADPSDRSILAVLILGVVGTGMARALAASLAGRTGASRSALVAYLVPVVAIALGVLFRSESVEAVEIGGTILVLFGAYLTTRPQYRPRSNASPKQPHQM